MYRSTNGRRTDKVLSHQEVFDCFMRSGGLFDEISCVLIRRGLFHEIFCVLRLSVHRKSLLDSDAPRFLTPQYLKMMEEDAAQQVTLSFCFLDRY